MSISLHVKQCYLLWRNTRHSKGSRHGRSVCVPGGKKNKDKDVGAGAGWEHLKNMTKLWWHKSLSWGCATGKKYSPNGGMVKCEILHKIPRFKKLLQDMFMPNSYRHFEENAYYQQALRELRTHRYIFWSLQWLLPFVLVILPPDHVLKHTTRGWDGQPANHRVRQQQWELWGDTMPVGQAGSTSQRWLHHHPGGSGVSHLLWPQQDLLSRIPISHIPGTY